MKYYLIAGEASGDLHGSNLMRGLLKSDPAARFRFWGGDRMAEVGGAENRVRDYRETSFFGIVGVLRNLGTISRQLRECREDVLRYAPDVLILVDYPGFNMKMARFAKEHGIRTFYYIAPKVWAWREWRVKAIRRYVDRLYIIFPFERDYFPRHGITPVFEGNPLLDAIAGSVGDAPLARGVRPCERTGRTARGGARGGQPPRRNRSQPAADVRAGAPFPALSVRGDGRLVARPRALRPPSCGNRRAHGRRPDLRNAPQRRRGGGHFGYGHTGNGADAHPRSGRLPHRMVAGMVAALRAESALHLAGEPQPRP